MELRGGERTACLDPGLFLLEHTPFRGKEHRLGVLILMHVPTNVIL